MFTDNLGRYQPRARRVKAPGENEGMTRKYELRQRATSQAETRERIVEATVALHGSVGPSRTTISAIAVQAGVQRLTVYRHFPDERSLFQACSSHWRLENPPPDPGTWAALDDPAERLETALAEIYAYFRRTEQMIANIRRDRPESPVIQEVGAPLVRYWELVRKTLTRGWKVRGRRRKLTVAAIGHAIDFDTWRSLVRSQGLDDREAVELMVQLSCAASSPTRRG
jgi:AcrR family transcriptional regulator